MTDAGRPSLCWTQPSVGSPTTCSSGLVEGRGRQGPPAGCARGWGPRALPVCAGAALLTLTSYVDFTRGFPTWATQGMMDKQSVADPHNDVTEL